MREISRSWIDYTNARKQAMEEARRKEVVKETIPIHAVESRAKIKLPKFTSTPVERPANVNYAVSLFRMKKLAKELGSINMPYRDVGLRSFDYTYDDLVGKE